MAAALDQATARISSSFADQPEAEPEMRTALNIAEQAYPEGGPGVAGYQSFLGRVLAARRRFSGAEPLLIAAYDAHLEAYGAENQGTAAAAASLVDLYDAWGRPDDAARYRQD